MPWLPGTVERQCGPDEWLVCVEDRDVAILADGRRAPRGTASRNLYYPMCFRDASEIRRRPVTGRGQAQHADLVPGQRAGRATEHNPNCAAGAVAVSGGQVIRGAATVAVCMVAGIGVVMSGIGACGLSRGHGQAGAAAYLLPVSTAGLVAVASLVLVHEARNRRAAPGLARVMLWTGIAAMAGAGIASGARYGLLGGVLSAWPAVACGGAAEMAVQLVRRPAGQPDPGLPAPAGHAYPVSSARHGRDS